MSSIRFTSFGAATVPLSKIIPDKDFDIRPYGITAAFARFPYRPIDWETEELDWGDGAETVVFSKRTALTPTTNEIVWTNPSSYYRQIRVTAVQEGSGAAQPVITIDGTTVYSGTKATFEAGPFWVPPGKEIKIVSQTSSAYLVQIDFYDTGLIGGQKTFDLTGKWLALGIDMKGLTATVKIQGVEMPYSDYAMYFPLAPSEVTIPGEWDASQERPIIEVYK